MKDDEAPARRDCIFLLLRDAIDAERLLSSDDLVHPLRVANSWEARRPSLMASAVACFEFPDKRGGRGTTGTPVMLWVRLNSGGS